MEGTEWTALQVYLFKIWESLRNKLGYIENFLKYLPVGLKPKLKLGVKMLYQRIACSFFIRNSRL